jgi:hypothetical protein
MQANSAHFLPIVDENRILYDWFLSAGQLHHKFRDTPKEEPISYCFFCYSTASRTNQPHTIRYSRYGLEDPPRVLCPYRCQRSHRACYQCG